MIIFYNTILESVIDDLENIFIYEAQHIPLYKPNPNGEGTITEYVKYFSLDEIKAIVLSAFSKVKSPDNDDFEKISELERKKILLFSSAIVLRKIIEDVKSDSIEGWKKDLFASTAEKEKMVENFTKLASDYEEAANDGVFFNIDMS